MRVLAATAPGQKPKLAIDVLGPQWIDVAVVRKVNELIWKDAERKWLETDLQ